MEVDEANNVQYFMDGDLWCAVRPDFTDLAESAAGFGNTKEEALEDLQENELK